MITRGAKGVFIVNYKQSNEELANLSIVENPDGVIGDIQKFINYDPTRILHFEIEAQRLMIYMKETMRLEAIDEFKSTIEAFHYEVLRNVRLEVEAFYIFEYDEHFSHLTFTVNRTEFEQDITAKMIELSIVEDALKYQIYSRKKIGVNVYYKDRQTNEIFKSLFYPENIEK